MASIEEPKKAPSAYFIFINENRAEFTKELGGKAQAGPFAKLAASKWGALSEGGRAPYVKKAEEAKVKYEQDMAKFKEAGGQAGLKRKEKAEMKQAKAEKAEKKALNANKPKRPAGGAYGCFMAEKRAEIIKTMPAGSPCTMISKIGSERWKKLSESEKAPYAKLYETRKAQYDAEMKAWKESKAAAGGAAGDDDEDGDEEDGDGDEEETPESEPSPKRAKTEVPASGADKAVFDEAKQLGYTQKLKALMDKPQVKNIAVVKVLGALKEAGGSTVVAKKALSAAGA